jgi:hypothetical protein
MKKQILLIVSIITSITAFSQVIIDVPYENGQVTVTVNISYPKTITTADSILVESCYQSYSDANNTKTFGKEKVVKGFMKSITLDNSFERRENLRSYRCTIYLKDKKTIISNEVQIDYNGYKYNETPLPKVTNIQSVVFEKDGSKYITLTWNAVPNAFGYVIAERDWNGAEQYFKFQLGYGGPMSESITNSFTFLTEASQVVREYGIIAVNSPNENISEVPFAEIPSIKVSIP